MATLPKIRNKISISAGNKNQSLKDILVPMGVGTEVVSVEAISTPVYNTKAIVKIDSAKAAGLDESSVSSNKSNTRVVLYNRVDIASVLPESIVASFEDLPAVIKELNSVHRCDFTEDDLELVDNILKAKTTSLGYIGEVEVKVGGGASPILYHHNLGMFALDVYNDISFDQYYFKLTLGVSGTVIDEVFDPDTMWDDYHWFRNWFPVYWISNAIGDHGANEFEFFNDYNTSPATIITNLRDEENSLTYEYGRIIDGERVAVFNRTFNFLPNGERLAPDASLFNAVVTVDLDDFNLIEETLLSSNVEYYEIEHNGHIFKESPEFRLGYIYDNPSLINMLDEDLMHRIGFGDLDTVSIVYDSDGDLDTVSTVYDSDNGRYFTMVRIYNNTGDYLKLAIKAKLEGVDELLTVIDVELGTIAK